MLLESNNNNIIPHILLLLTLAVSLSRQESKVGSSLATYNADDVINKSPSEILKLRGFKSEVHFVRTQDGYYVHLVHIINPKLRYGRPLKRPVIFNHGLLESSTIWLINSLNVRPMDLSNCDDVPSHPNAYNGTFYLNGPMMLANTGYDVWLMSMRGTDFTLRHAYLTPLDPEFWNYCLDDFALKDIPAAVNYVAEVTDSKKIGYIGHSQATFSIFGLLSTYPDYAEVIEPIVAVAPVAYFDHISSISRVLFLAVLKGTDKDRHAHFPPYARQMRNAFSTFCGSLIKSKANDICQFIEFLISGKGKEWLRGYFNHLPFMTSLKVLRHFGQLIDRKKYARYDYGTELNLKHYGTIDSPSYQIKNIRSRAISLISTKSDALSPPEDVERFKRNLTVPLFRDIYIDRDFNHFDLITHEDSRKLVFKPIMDIFETFSHCKPFSRKSFSQAQIGDSQNSFDKLKQLEKNTIEV